MLVRFCDRCGADVTAVAWSRLDRVTVPDAQGGGTIDRIWDLCAACMGQITAAVESSQAGRAVVVSMRSLGDLD